MSAAAPREDEGAATAALEDAVGLAFRVLSGLVVLLLVLFIGSGVFTVGPNELGFVRRLGVLDPTPRGPGAHLAWPLVDVVERVDVGSAVARGTEAFDLQRTARDLARGVAERRGGVDPRREGYLVTGDANLVHATLVARTRIDAPQRALRAFVDADAAVVALLERAAVQAAAGRPVDGLLGADKAAFLDDVARRLGQGLAALPLPGDDPADPRGAGLAVQGVELERDLVPPPQAREAFDAVHRAAQDLDRLRSEALAVAARTRGEAVAGEARVRSEGRTRAERILADARADAAVFEAQLLERRRDPRGYEDRRLATTLAEALGRVEECFLVGEGPLRLRLERDAKALRQALEAQARARELGGAPPAQGGP